MPLIRDMITGKDGQTHDIARVIILVNAVMLVPVLALGVSFYLYGYIMQKPFDVQTFFTAVLTYEGGVGALLTSGAASILMKKSTEPDGAVNDTVSITKGTQTNITERTTIVQ